jgi:hypothetical protein
LLALVQPVIGGKPSGKRRPLPILRLQLPQSDANGGASESVVGDRYRRRLMPASNRIDHAPFQLHALRITAPSEYQLERLVKLVPKWMAPAKAVTHRMRRIAMRAGNPASWQRLGGGVGAAMR